MLANDKNYFTKKRVTQQMAREKRDFSVTAQDVLHIRQDFYNTIYDKAKAYCENDESMFFKTCYRRPNFLVRSEGSTQKTRKSSKTGKAIQDVEIKTVIHPLFDLKGKEVDDF